MSERPSVLVFDVNETLSDMSPMRQRFEEVGAPGHLATAWFAAVLRDGFALAVTGTSAPLADIAAESLRSSLHGVPLTRDVQDAVEHIIQGFTALPVHPDVPGGIQALHQLGFILVTLSNGAASVAEALLERAGIRDQFQALLSVESAGIWKPATPAYTYALERCGVNAADAMLVAVHPWDIDGATRGGLRTAWINRTGQAYPAHFHAPELAAGSLTELADRLA